MNNDLERIYEKIQKCLNLGKSCNQHEAALAIKQAQNLMKKHNISELEMNILDIKEKSLDVSFRNYRFTEMQLATSIASIFDCRFFWRNFIVKNKELVFYGIEPNLTIASYAFSILLPIIKKDRKEYVRSLPDSVWQAERIALGNQFVVGWLQAVRKECENLNPNMELQEKLKAYEALRLEKLTMQEDQEKEVDRALLLHAISSGIEKGSEVDLYQGLHGASETKFLNMET